MKTFLKSIILLLLLPSVSWAAPSISGVTGTISDGESVTITGTAFGANGPTMLVYDNFEGGVNGNSISTGGGSAIVGQWDRVGGGDDSNPPIYSNSYTVSGSLAFRGDHTKKVSSGDDTCAAAFSYMSGITEVFITYWWMLPTTSAFPGENPGGDNNPNWKTAWVYGDSPSDDDQIIYEMLLGMTGTKDVSCNDCYNYWLCDDACAQPGCVSWMNSTNIYWTETTTKQNWQRVSVWLKATFDCTGRRTVWTLSPGDQDNKAYTARIDWTGRHFKLVDDSWSNFIINPWARWCDGCDESYAFFDDVYCATGPYARARVEIGDANIYDNCTNLTIATVNSWGDSSISAIMRQGSFVAEEIAYVFVVDADGSVSAGYQVTIGDESPSPPHRVIILQ